MNVQISGAKTVATSIPIQDVSINQYILSVSLDEVNFSLVIDNRSDGITKISLIIPISLTLTHLPHTYMYMHLK